MNIKMEKKSFKQKWNSVDEVCDSCGQVTKINRGLTKQNLKKLFKRPSSQDLIIFILLILVFFGSWAYINEVVEYKKILSNPEELCNDYNKINLNLNQYNQEPINNSIYKPMNLIYNPINNSINNVSKIEDGKNS